MEIRWPEEIRVTTLKEFVQAFYEAALEDELTWTDEEARSLANLAMSDFFRRFPDRVSLA